jgi:hypothetical protein
LRHRVCSLQQLSASAGKGIKGRRNPEIQGVTAVNRATAAVIFGPPDGQATKYCRFGAARKDEYLRGKDGCGITRVLRRCRNLPLG